MQFAENNYDAVYKFDGKVKQVMSDLETCTTSLYCTYLHLHSASHVVSKIQH